MLSLIKFIWFTQLSCENIMNKYVVDISHVYLGSVVFSWENFGKLDIQNMKISKFLVTPCVYDCLALREVSPIVSTSSPPFIAVYRCDQLYNKLQTGISVQFILYSANVVLYCVQITKYRVQCMLRCVQCTL